MPVVAAIKLNDLVPLRKTAGEPDGRHGGFRAGVAHAHFLDTRYERANEFRHRDFERIWNSEAGPIFSRLLNRLNDLGMCMAQDGRSPGTDVIHIFVSVHVPYMGPLGLVDEKRLAT